MERRTRTEGFLEILEDDQPIQDKCGVVAIIHPTPTKQFPFASNASLALQHRGQAGTGGAAFDGRSTFFLRGPGLIEDFIRQPEIQQFQQPTLWTLMHNRYGTNGEMDTKNIQPCTAKTSDGESVAVIHNGEFSIPTELTSRFAPYLGASDTVIFTNILANLPSSSWEHRIETALSMCPGAYSIVIGTDEGIFAARDPDGIRPLILGRVGDGWMIASETHAFNRIGATVERMVLRGELLKIDVNGPHVVREGQLGLGHACFFEHAYIGHPTSRYPTYEHPDDDLHPERWATNTWFRYRMGNVLAHEHPVSGNAVVVGVPDSGLAAAAGYAATLILPQESLLVREHFSPEGRLRSFMQDSHLEEIPMIVRGRISFVTDPAFWKDSIIVFVDDSIVRGNVSAQITEQAFALGAREVHWRSSFCMIQHTCSWGVSMRTREELIAARLQGSTKAIAQEIGADSVAYISPQGLLSALMPGRNISNKDGQTIFWQHQFCGRCITGDVGKHDGVSNNGTLTEVLPLQTALR